MKCTGLSTRTGRPCALPAGHGREQHLDTIEMRAEMDGMAASFAMGLAQGRRDACARRESEAMTNIAAMGDEEREEFFAKLKREFCIHCTRRRHGETCHCENDE